MKRGRVLYAIEVERAEGTSINRTLYLTEAEALEVESDLRNKAPDASGVLDVKVYPLKVGKALAAK